jgi:hypothetical protein
MKEWRGIFRKGLEESKDFILNCPDLSSVTDEITESTYNKIISILELEDDEINCLFFRRCGLI